MAFTRREIVARSPGAGPGEAFGFTLMELVVVMTLLAIMSLTVSPIFRGSFSGVRAEHSMRDLFAAMKSAQSGAVTEAVEYRVYLAPDENQYWIAHAVFSEEGEVSFEALAGRSGEVIELPSIMEMMRPKARQGEEKGTYYFSFYPSGACDIASVAVAFSDDSRRQYHFETTGTTVSFEVPQS